VDTERVSVHANKNNARTSKCEHVAPTLLRTRGSPGTPILASAGAFSLGVEVPLLLQFSIALFAGMVAATFVPPVRRSIPRPVEILLWIALVSVCIIGVTSVTDPNARELSTSAAWAANQILGTMVALLLGGAGGWISDHRFPIASWMVIIAGADILALMLLGSLRSARASQPRVRLREWMELPVPAQHVAGRQSVLADPLADVNRRIAAAAAVAGAVILARLVDASIWFRDVMLPRQTERIAHAAAVGRVESRARLESLRDATAHLQYAARAWYQAAGEPAFNELAGRAQRSLRPARLRAGQVIDIQALLSAQSIGWYGPMSAGPTPSPGEKDAAESQRSDRMAS
jgi:hypothetical protein